MIMESSIALDFKEWLHYIRALAYDEKYQALALLTLISYKLDLKSSTDF
jgi:hypothetical protein